MLSEAAGKAVANDHSYGEAAFECRAAALAALVWHGRLSNQMQSAMLVALSGLQPTEGGCADSEPEELAALVGVRVGNKLGHANVHGYAHGNTRGNMKQGHGSTPG